MNQSTNIDRYHFPEIGSTNTWAKENAESFAKDRFTIVTAAAQTSGRGRFKREWVSPPNQNIYATFCCFIESSRSDVGHIPQVLAIAATDTIEMYGVTSNLKWPNDVVIQGKKIAGILCETVMIDGGLFVITGIGLNVNMPLELLEQIDRPATSMLAESSKVHSVEEVLKNLESTFIPMLTNFLQTGFFQFLNRYRIKQGMQEGDPVRFHDNLQIWEGFFYGINDDGSLTLRLQGGQMKTFLAGEFL